MMKVFDFVETLAMFHYHVMHGSTGNAQSFAEKLGISRSCLYNMIEALRDYGIEIYYSRPRQSYLYTHPDRVEIRLIVQQRDS